MTNEEKECPRCVRCGLEILDPKDGVELTYFAPGKFACRECFNELAFEVEAQDD